MLQSQPARLDRNLWLAYAYFHNQQHRKVMSSPLSWNGRVGCGMRHRVGSSAIMNWAIVGLSLRCQDCDVLRPQISTGLMTTLAHEALPPPQPCRLDMLCRPDSGHNPALHLNMSKTCLPVCHGREASVQRALNAELLRKLSGRSLSIEGLRQPRTCIVVNAACLFFYPT